MPRARLQEITHKYDTQGQFLVDHKVNWENLSAGNHTQMLEVTQRCGGLYQATQSSFLVSDASQGSLTMSRTLLVAGAWISQLRITGEWSVRVSLGGKAITSQAAQLNP